MEPIKFIYPLVKDLSYEMIVESIKEARKKNIDDFRKHRQMLRDFYDNNQATLEYLFKWGFIDYKTKAILSHLPGISRNITKKVIDRISMCYRVPPTRALLNAKDKPIKDDQYNLFIQDNPAFHPWLKNAERRFNLLGNVLLRPSFIKDQNEMKFFIESDYIAYFTYYDPLHPIGYDIPMRVDVESSKVKQEKWLFINDDFMFYHDQNGNAETVGDLPDFKNPYSIAPLVDFSDFAVDDYWSLGEKNLVEANRMLNIMTLTGMYGFHFQSFDQPYVSGADESDIGQIRLGPHNIAFGPEGSTMSLLGYNPNFSGMTEWLGTFNQTILDDHGLQASFEDPSNIASGVALKIKNQELLENRQDKIDLFRLKEGELLNVISAMTEYHPELKYKIPKDTKLRINFEEIEFPVTEQEERDQYEFERKNNFTTPIEWLKSKDPDLTDDAAQELLDKNKEVNQTQVSLAGNKDNITDLLRGGKNE